MKPKAKVCITPRETEREITSEVKPLEAAFKDLRSEVREWRGEMEWKSRAEEWKCKEGRRK